MSESFESTDISQPDEVQPYQGESWDFMAETAHQVKGADFTKGDVLLGVPFMAVSMTLRQGDFKHKECGKPHPYMFVTAVVGPERDIQRAVKRGRLSEEDSHLIDPGEVLGFNEAGTGVYRQILAYLESQEYIRFPEGPADGAFGESRFDSHPDTWDFAKGDLRFASTEGHTGEPVYTANFRLLFPRGLRLSEYSNEYTREGRTRYAG